MRRLLAAPADDGPQARRDRATLALDDLDLDAGTIRVLGKGYKARTIHLMPLTAAALAA